jgi:hypothetical protein
MQTLPLLAWVLAGVIAEESRRVRLVWVSAGSYCLLFALLLAQALRGESIAAPSAGTLAAFAAWALATAAAAWIARSGTAPLRTTTALVG